MYILQILFLDDDIIIYFTEICIQWKLLSIIYVVIIVYYKELGGSYDVINMYDMIMMSVFRYLGGLRLLQAVCKKFYQYCSEKG